MTVCIETYLATFYIAFSIGMLVLSRVCHYHCSISRTSQVSQMITFRLKSECTLLCNLTPSTPYTNTSAAVGVLVLSLAAAAIMRVGKIIHLCDNRVQKTQLLR